jgi:hypothetical protein
MARIAIRNGERVRECEEADFPHFAERGFVKVDAPAEPEGEPQAEPFKATRKRK